MKKTNRILSLVVAASMMLGLTGCGSSAYSTGSCCKLIFIRSGIGKPGDCKHNC